MQMHKLRPSPKSVIRGIIDEDREYLDALYELGQLDCEEDYPLYCKMVKELEKKEEIDDEIYLKYVIIKF